jgi:hypothetical protein
MAISGGAKPSVELQIIDGQLYVGPQAMRQGVVNDIDLAVQRLAQGERVYVQTYGDLPARVQRTINMMLGSEQ